MHSRFKLTHFTGGVSSLSSPLAAVLITACLGCTEQPSQSTNDTPTTEAQAITVSPPHSLATFVETLGYLDGVTCETWPRELRLSDSESVSALHAKYALGTPAEQTMAQSTGWLLDQATRLGVDEMSAIGSPSELVILPIDRDGATEPIVIDTAKQIAYSLHYERMCTPSDLKNSNCREATVDVSVLGTVRLLERKSARQPTEDATATPRTVLLTAPRVRVASDTRLDVGLLIAAETFVGGPPLAPNERPSERSGNVALAVDMYAAPSLATWRQAVAGPPRSGILAVLAREAGGVTSLRIDSRRPIRSISVSDTGEEPSSALDTAGNLTLPASQFAEVTSSTVAEGTPSELPPNIDTSQSSSGEHGVTIRRKRWIPVSRTIAITLPSLQTSWQQGSAVYFASGSTSTPALAAPPLSPIPVSATTLNRFAYSVLDVPSSACSTSAQPNPNDTSLEYLTTCRILTSVRLTINGQEYPISDIEPSFVNGDMQSYRSPLYDTFAETLRNAINARSGGANTDVSEVTGTANSQSAAMLAGQLFSRGLLFEQLYRGAEAESLITGAMSDRYRALSEYLEGFNANAYSSYVSNTRREFLTEIRKHLDVAAITDTGRVNALGLPYGKLATGWARARASGTTDYPSSIDDVTARWQQLGTLASELKNAIENLNDDAHFTLLANDLNRYIDQSRNTAMALEAAALDSVTNGTRSLEKLDTTANELTRATDELKRSWASAWNCPGFDSCGETLALHVESLKQQCPPKANSAFFFKLLDGVIAAVPYVGTAASALKAIQSVQEFLKKNPGIANFYDLSQSELTSAIETMKQINETASTIKTIADATKAALEGWKKFNDFIQDHPEECDKNSIPYRTLQNLMATTAVQKGLLDTMAVQAATLELVSESILNTVTFQKVNSLSNAQLKTAASDLARSLSGMHPNSSDWPQQRESFVVKACETAQLATRAAQAELHHVSQVLQSSVGRPETTPFLTIPADPRSSSLAPGYSDSDYDESFYVSLWDAEAFGSRFSADGSRVTRSFIERASARFKQLTEVQLCNAPDSTLPKTRFIVRKVISGDQLNRFKSTGRADFSISLDDVIEGGNAIGKNSGEARLTAVAERRAGESSFDVDNDQKLDLDLTSPILLASAYSGCTGPTSDPCCKATSCRVPIQANSAPMLVGHGINQIATVCDNPNELTYSNVLIRDINKFASTCMSSVSTPRQISELPYTDATLGLSQLILEHVDSSICNQPSTGLLFRNGRGLPVLGTWSIASTAEHAAIIQSELLSTNSVPPPDGSWSTATSPLTGVEVLFFVGAEARNEPQRPAYQLSDTTRAQEQMVTDAFGFETAGYWFSPQARLSQSAQVASGSSALSVQGAGYLPIRSLPLPLGPLAPNATRMSVDLLIPTNQPNPWWTGTSQMFVNIPSAGIFNAYIGQVELTQLPLGGYSTLDFTLPQSVLSALQTARTDVRITIALNINGGTGPFLLDNLRIR